jgi:hypothetical protein
VRKAQNRSTASHRTMNVEERPFQDRVFAIFCENFFSAVCRGRRVKRREEIAQKTAKIAKVL